MKLTAEQIIDADQIVEQALPVDMWQIYLSANEIIKEIVRRIVLLPSESQDLFIEYLESQCVK